MGNFPDALRDVLLYGLAVLAFLGPIEGFLRFRVRQANRLDPRGVYLARSDPWVSAIVALAGLGTIALVRALA